MMVEINSTAGVAADAPPQRRGGTHELIGSSRAMLRLMDVIRAVAPLDLTVLLIGETGVGKNLVARTVHRLSGRPAERFIAVNCGAVPPGVQESELFGHERGSFTGAVRTRIGKLEAAQGGTLFLDEIETIRPELQVDLLHVLEERRFTRVGASHALDVDVRFIVATNEDLTLAVTEGRFRRDLFYRINAFPLVVPPLRERVEDVPVLARAFLHDAAERLRKPLRDFHPRVLAELMAHDWPGNVRELINVVERAAIFSDGPLVEDVDLHPTGEFGAAPGKDGAPRAPGGLLHSPALDTARFGRPQGPASLPGRPAHESPLFDPTTEADISLAEVRRRACDRAEAAYLDHLLRRYQGDPRDVARHARISRRSFYYKMKRHRIKAATYR